MSNSMRFQRSLLLACSSVGAIAMALLAFPAVAQADYGTTRVANNKSSDQPYVLPASTHAEDANSGGNQQSAVAGGGNTYEMRVADNDGNQQVAPAASGHGDETQLADNTGSNDKNAGAANQWGGGIETVVVTGSRFNPNSAPAKASLDTTEPQTIINKEYIQDSIQPTADYVTILGIAPSMTGLSINGPGMSDGNVKNTLRGQPDGNFAMTWDNIPFGDTNGPTHHSESYFPSSTIGSIDVERGPGNAGNLGAATYGGTINLFSEGLTDDFRARQTFTYGSWNTFNINTNVQSGALDLIDNGPTRAMINFQYTGSQGYLSHQTTMHDTEEVKLEQDLGNGWSVTFLANRNGLQQHVSDVNGATPGQVHVREEVRLSPTTAALPDYYLFNGQHKETDIDYLRFRGPLGHAVIDDQPYTYAYVNRTVTANDIEQTLAPSTTSADVGLDVDTVAAVALGRRHESRRRGPLAGCSGLYKAQCLSRLGQHLSRDGRFRLPRHAGTDPRGCLDGMAGNATSSRVLRRHAMHGRGL